MLRRGHFVADVLCYTGDHQYRSLGAEANRGRRGRRSRWARATRTIWSTPRYCCHDCRVEDGDLVLPDGMRYRVLAVDLEGETVDTRALTRIVELAEEGATIVLGERRPTRAPGLRELSAVRRTGRPPGGVNSGAIPIDRRRIGTLGRALGRTLGQGPNHLRHADRRSAPGQRHRARLRGALGLPASAE